MLKRIAWITIAALIGGFVRHAAWRALDGHQAPARPQAVTVPHESPRVAHGLLQARVIAVLDGDTVEVLDTTQRQHRIRLAGIDAPELAHPGMAAQPYGRQAKDALAEMTLGRSVRVEILDVDGFGREIGAIACNGWDVNLAMVRLGAAWAYRQYLTGPNRGTYIAAEGAAHTKRRGLWVDAEPVAPWEWRKESRNEK